VPSHEPLGALWLLPELPPAPHRALAEAAHAGTGRGLLAQPHRLVRVGNSSNGGTGGAALATFVEGSWGGNDTGAVCPARN
jgi:hypothetical protein